MAKYQVFDNNLPATHVFHRVDKSWNRSVFDDRDEAIEYASRWLGMYGPFQGNLNGDFEYMPGSIISVRRIHDSEETTPAWHMNFANLYIDLESRRPIRRINDPTEVAGTVTVLYADSLEFGTIDLNAEVYLLPLRG